METLVFVGDNRNNQCHGRVNSPGHARFRSFSSRNSCGIHCRQSGARVKSPSRKIIVPVASSLPSSHSPQQFLSSSYNFYPVTNTPLKVSTSTSPLHANGDINKNQKPLAEELSIRTKSFSYSERWAGPTYSNSPPPRSLPVPTFSLRSRRSESLDLPATKLVIEIPPSAKSAPASPAKGDNPSVKELFLKSDSATKTLRRILNLDDPDD